MFDVELVKDIISKVIWSIEQILIRSETINNYEDFYKDDID